jgi:pimeloyl-ACP methyl ester carboxylesterase
MAAVQRPAALAALGTPSGAPAWKSIPSWYLVAGADQAIPPAAQRYMADRVDAHTSEVKGASHAVMVSPLTPLPRSSQLQPATPADPQAATHRRI